MASRDLLLEFLDSLYISRTVEARNSNSADRLTTEDPNEKKQNKVKRCRERVT